jgi:hypothetical protein
VKPGIHLVPADPEPADCVAGGTSVTEVPFLVPAELTATIEFSGIGQKLRLSNSPALTVRMKDRHSTAL